MNQSFQSMIQVISDHLINNLIEVNANLLQKAALQIYSFIGFY